MAAAAPVQLGHRLVRRIRPRQHPHGVAHRPRRRRQAARGLGQLRRVVRAQHPRGELDARARRGEGRSHPAHAAQHHAPLGADARRHEAGRGDHPRHHPAHAAKTWPTASPAATCATQWPRRRWREAERLRRAQDAPGGGRRRGRMDAVRRGAQRQERAPLPRAHLAGRSAAALLHLRDDGASPSWCCTRSRATRSATSPPCTGSGCAKATCTRTSALRAGPSTPGAASCPLERRRDHPGARRPTLQCGADHRPSAREVGGHALRPPTVWRMLVLEDLGPGRPGCASCSAPASRSTRR